MAAISGTVISSIMLHDFDGTKTDGDSFSGIVPTQRVKIEFDHNKTEYNTAILGGSFTGNFDANIVSFSAFIVDSPPIAGVSLPPPNGTTLLTSIESNTSTNRVDSCVFRVEEDWANNNLIKYVVGQWTFTYSDGTNTITDYIRKTIDLNFRAFEGNDTNIEFLEIVDDTSTAIGETLCDSYNGKLYPKFQSNLSGEYTQGLVTYDTKGGIKEENNHTNTNIAKSDTTIVSALSPVNPINDTDGFQFCVDLAEFNPNQTAGYCFNTVLIYEGVLSSTSCDCIDIQLAQTIVTSNALQISFDMAFTLSGGITSGEVDNIEFQHNGTIIGTYEFSGTLTGSINVLLESVGGVFPASEYTVIINRSNGCNYSSTHVLTPTTTTLDDSTCTLYCTVSFTSPDPTGSNVYFQSYGGTPVLGDPSGYDGQARAGQLIIDITAWLDSNGYIYNQVLVTVGASGQINDVVITGTNLPLGIIEIFYEDYGVETGVVTGCLEYQNITKCTVQWDGVLTDGAAFLQLADGTNIGDVGGYVGAQSLAMANDLKAYAEAEGFVCGTVSSGVNGNGWVDSITIFATNIPENYYRVQWLATPQVVYGVASSCNTTGLF